MRRVGFHHRNFITHHPHTDKHSSRTLIEHMRLRAIAALLFAALSAGVSASCTSSKLSSTSPTTTKCQVSAKSSASEIAAAGGTTTVAVTAEPECQWQASAGANWITELTPSSGQGNSEVRVRVAANADPVARQGMVHIATVDIPIMQDAAPCVFQVTPLSRSVNAAGGTTTVAVAGNNACTWTAESTASWVSIQSGARGAGNGTVTIAVTANAGAARSGVVAVAGQSVTINQSALECSFSLSGTSQAVGASGGNAAPVGVTTAAACNWTAVSNAGWITVSSGANGSGNGTVTFTVAANTGAARTGALTIAGQSYTVTQSAVSTPAPPSPAPPPPAPPPAPACSYTIAPTGASIGASGGGGNAIAVTTTNSCSWTAVSNSAWITITSGNSDNGNGTVKYSVAANNGSTPRTGTITVAGQTFTVSQAVNCTYQINPTSQSFPLSGGTGSVAVTAPASCAWTAASKVDWVTITSGAAGSGNGTVAFTVEATSNNKDRNGSLTIASQTFTVAQTKN